MKNLTQEEWKKGVTDGYNIEILDVRTPDEFNERYIPGAKNIDIYKGQGFLDEVNELDKTKEYYVYCRSGARSAQACALMEQQGFENTNNLMGGINEWKGEVTN
ncbi:MAG TPA: rhodanese-like domain-containing protein [Gillisia sp.]|nr:rhodanese-like domain-containing protein [Gillisia sp.]